MNGWVMLRSGRKRRCLRSIGERSRRLLGAPSRVVVMTRSEASDTPGTTAQDFAHLATRTPADHRSLPPVRRPPTRTLSRIERSDVWVGRSVLHYGRRSRPRARPKPYERLGRSASGTRHSRIRAPGYQTGVRNPAISTPGADMQSQCLGSVPADD